MADVFGNTQFGIPTVTKSQPASPAPSPPDEDVDPLGIPGDIPPAEPDQPEPVLLVLSPRPDKDTPADRDTGETTTASPPDEGVDPFGQTFETPPPEPDQPAPVTVDPVTPPVITSPVDGIGTGHRRRCPNVDADECNRPNRAGRRDGVQPAGLHGRRRTGGRDRAGPSPPPRHCSHRLATHISSSIQRCSSERPNSVLISGENR